MMLAVGHIAAEACRCGSMQVRKHADAEVCVELVSSLQTPSHDTEWQQLGIAQGHGIPAGGTYTGY